MKPSLILLVAALPLSAQPGAGEVLNQARNALGPKLSAVRTLSVWGRYRRAPLSGQIAVSFDLAGVFRVEHSSLTSGGEIQRAGGDGSSASGGMPGDDGGPAMSLGLSEGLTGDDYWVRNGAGLGKRALTGAYIRYALALLLAAPDNLPVTFNYGGHLESPRGTVDALEVKGPDGFLVHLYLDSKSHLPVTMVYHEDGQEVQMWFKDARPENGIRFPHLVAWVVNGSVVEEFQIDHFRVNSKVKVEKARQ